MRRIQIHVFLLSDLDSNTNGKLVRSMDADWIRNEPHWYFFKYYVKAIYTHGLPIASQTFNVNQLKIIKGINLQNLVLDFVWTEYFGEVNT